MASLELPDQAVREFQEIYEKEFGKKIGFDEARVKAENFISLIRLITKPIPKESDK